MLLGIDIGTTVLKVAAYESKTGRLIGVSSKSIPTQVTSDGGRQQDPAQLLGLLRNSIEEIRETVGYRWKALSGVGLASQGGSTLIVRRETGKPLTPLILWNDPRAFPQFHRIKNSQKPGFWRSFSLRDEPGMGLARIEWLRENGLKLFSDSHLYVGAGEYVFHYLTGEWRQDPCNALQIGCYNACSHQLTDKPLRPQKIPLSLFAPLRDGHSHQPLDGETARVLDVRPGIPVAGPYIDQEAGYMSTLGESESPLHVSLGTAWVGNFTVPRGCMPVSPFQFVVPSPLGDGNLVILPLLTGNVTWDWALKMFVDPDLQSALKRQDQFLTNNLLPPQGLVAVPWLNRPNPLDPEVNGALSFCGISPMCQPQDLLRASAVGMVYELFRVLGIHAGLGIVDSIALTGGASKGWFFQKLIATLFAPLPARVAVDEDYAVTRGALFSFMTNASSVKLRKVKKLKCDLASHVADGFRHYMKVFNSIYKGEPAGSPFQIRGMDLDIPF